MALTGSFGHHIHISQSGGYQSGSSAEIPGLYYLPAVVGGLFVVGTGLTDFVYADANEVRMLSTTLPWWATCTACYSSYFGYKCINLFTVFCFNFKKLQTWSHSRVILLNG